MSRPLRLVCPLLLLGLQWGVLALAQTAEPPPPADTKPAAAEAEPPAKPSTPEVVPVSDAAKLRTFMGRSAVVQGKVKRVEALKTGTVRVWFEGAESILYIRKGSLAAHPDWKPGELEGRDIFATGTVADYKGRLELVVERPTQIAQSAEKLDLSTGNAKKGGTTGGGGKAEGGTTTGEGGPPFKTESAAVGQLRAITTGVAQPYVAYERFQGAAARGSRGSSPPITIESFSGKDRAPALAGLDWVRNTRGWPRGVYLRVKRAGGNPGPGLPVGMTVALMLESMVEDVPVPENFAVLGTMAPNGSLNGGAEEVLMLAKAQAPDNLVVAVPPSVEGALFDVAMDGDWAAFCRFPLLEVADIPSLKKLAREAASPDFTAALAPLAEIRSALEKNPEGALRSPAMKTKLEALAKVRPDLLNVRVLQKMLANEAPKTWSSPTTGARLRQFYLKATEEANNLRFSKSNDPRKTAKALKDAFADVSRKAHPDWKRFHDALAAWVDALADSIRYDSKDTSARAKKNAEAVKSSAATAKTEYEEALKMKL